MKQVKWLQGLIGLATVLCLVVINVGAYTRLSHAGLGCPDWPGCYGRLLVPEGQAARNTIDQNYPNAPLKPEKAKIEMWHRYLAGSLGLLLIAISISAVILAVSWGGFYLFCGVGLLVLLGVQVLLGMWTVTMQLYPLIVTMHLLCALSILSLLWVLWLQVRKKVLSPRYSENSSVERNGSFWLKGLSALTLLVLIVQITLGGWTSTHYAGLVCKGFPLCHPASPLSYDFRNAFTWLVPLGKNYEGGLLSESAKMTIQMTHRFGALCLTALLALLSVVVFLQFNKNIALKRIMLFLGVMFICQVCLGAFSAIYQLPMTLALLHNLVAALLLIGLVTFNYQLYGVSDASYSQKRVT